MTARHQTSPFWFAAPLLAVYAAAFFIIEVLPDIEAPRAVTTGLTFDLVLLVPALYYVVLIRGRGWPVITLAPVFLLSFGAASLMIPAKHHALLNAISYALPVVELMLVGYVGYKAWRVVRTGRQVRSNEGDYYGRMRTMLRGAFDVPAVAGALAYEVSLFHYAFSFRRAEPLEHGFTYHRRSGYGAIFGAILMVAALELAAAHVLLWMWSETAALVHLVLSAYGVVWFVGDYRAMRQRPHELCADGIRVRFGLRWDLEVTWEQVAAVRRAQRPVTEDGYLNAVPVGSPKYIVELREPVEATGPYGIARDVRCIGVVVDEPEAFEERLRSLGIGVEA